MKKVVICGAGFGGVRVARDLLKKSKDLEITLINDSEYHCFHADLYEVAAAKLKHEDKLGFEHLSGTVNIPLSQIFKDKPVDILVDKITQIDLEKRTVKTSEKLLNYDFLILALGSTTNYFNIAGAKDFSHPIKNADDALNIHNDLEEQLRLNPNLKVVIAGGGFTGTELAGELAMFLPKTAQLSIVEGAANVLNGMPEWAQQAALKKLKQRKVDVILNCLITQVLENKIICQDGHEILFDYLIWTTGVSGENLAGQINGVTITKRGQISVTKTLNLENHTDVFIAGDLAEIKIADEKYAPTTAWAAIAEGEVVAKNILAMKSDKTLAEFKLPRPAFVVPIGSKYVVSNVYGFKLIGLSAWALKSLIALKYYVSILPFEQAIYLWFNGVRIYIKND